MQRGSIIHATVTFIAETRLKDATKFGGSPLLFISEGRN